MSGFSNKSVQQHVKDVLGQIKKAGGGTLNRQAQLNIWVGRARGAGISLEDRKSVVRRVNAADA